MKKRYFIPACVLIAVARPRRLRQATGRSPRAAFRIRPPNTRTKTKEPVLIDWFFCFGRLG